jgi:hypothetical protein
MYLELTERDRNAREMDQGMTLIAAGLARDENRNRIMSTYDQNGQTSMDASAFTAINEAQKVQAAARMHNQLRLALPAIAKQYGWSTEAVNMMFEAGTLEEAIKQASQPHYVTITRPDGSTAIVDASELQRETPGGTVNNQPRVPGTTPPLDLPPTVAEDQTPVPQPRVPGTTPPALDVAPAPAVAPAPGIETSGPSLPEPEWIDDPSGKGGKILAFKTKTGYVDASGKPIDTIKPLEPIEMIDDPSGMGGKIAVRKTADGYVRADTGEPISSIKAPPRKIVYQDDPASTGQLAFYEDGTPVPEKNIPGGDDLEFRANAAGQTQAYSKINGKAVGDPMGPTTDVSTDDQKEWAQASEAAKQRGEKFPTWDEWLKTLTVRRDPKPVSAYVDKKTGKDWGPPGTDLTYKLDAEGNMIMNPDTNTPEVTPMPGTKLYTEQAAAKEKEAGQIESKEQAAGIVGGMVDKAIKIMDEDTTFNPSTGVFAPLAGILEGSNRAQLEEALNPIKASVAFDALADMRRNSPTGGALGNVSDIELRLLASTLGSLEPRQGEESLKENLRLIKGITSGDRNALLEWRKKYNPNGKDMTPAEKAAADKAYDDKKATEQPPAGAKTKKYNPATGKIE